MEPLRREKILRVGDRNQAVIGIGKGFPNQYGYLSAPYRGQLALTSGPEGSDFRVMDGGQQHKSGSLQLDDNLDALLKKLKAAILSIPKLGKLTHAEIHAPAPVTFESVLAMPKLKWKSVSPKVYQHLSNAVGAPTQEATDAAGNVFQVWQMLNSLRVPKTAQELAVISKDGWLLVVNVKNAQLPSYHPGKLSGSYPRNGHFKTAREAKNKAQNLAIWTAPKPAIIAEDSTAPVTATVEIRTVSSGRGYGLSGRYLCPVPLAAENTPVLSLRPLKPEMPLLATRLISMRGKCLPSPWYTLCPR